METIFVVNMNSSKSRKVKIEEGNRSQRLIQKLFHEKKYICVLFSCQSKGSFISKALCLLGNALTKGSKAKAIKITLYTIPG